MSTFIIEEVKKMYGWTIMVRPNWRANNTPKYAVFLDDDDLFKDFKTLAEAERFCAVRGAEYARRHRECSR